MRIKGLKNRNLEFRAAGNILIDKKEFEIDDLKFCLKDETTKKRDLIIHIIYLSDGKYRFNIYKLKNRRPKP